jgi:hypothetical protein
MVASTKKRLDCFMQGFTRRNPGQPKFYQAAYELADAMVACGNI